MRLLPLTGEAQGQNGLCRGLSSHMEYKHGLSIYDLVTISTLDSAFINHRLLFVFGQEHL